MSKKQTARLQALFPGHIKKKTAEISSFWSKAHISMDANVLLNLYRYSENTSADFIRVIKGLSSKIFITNQVFSEYLKNKHDVIHSQLSLYSTKEIDQIKKVLENKNSHPFISNKTSELFDVFYNSLSSDYGEAVKRLDSRFSDDDIFESLCEVFEKAVLEGFEKDFLTKEIFNEGKARYAEKIPPGYEDAKQKGSDPSYDGLRSLYGDFIIWKELIKYSTDKGCDVIFVTGDKKSDWWKIVGGKTISPRPELCSEFLKSTSKNILIYTPEQFLKYANEHLNNSVRKESLEEVGQLQVDSILSQVLRRRVSRSVSGYRELAEGSMWALETEHPSSPLSFIKALAENRAALVENLEAREALRIKNQIMTAAAKAYSRNISDEQFLEAHEKIEKESNIDLGLFTEPSTAADQLDDLSQHTVNSLGTDDTGSGNEEPS